MAKIKIQIRLIYIYKYLLRSPVSLLSLKIQNICNENTVKANVKNSDRIH